MQFWKNLRNFNILLICVLSTACVDKIPSTIRAGKELAKTQYYGIRADKWQEIEDSYQGAKSNCCGPDTPNRDIRALELYCKAALMGHKASQVEVGRLYLHTAGAGLKTAIPFDRTLAHAYFSLAEQGGYDYAGAMAYDLEKKLTPEELVRSKQLVAQFPDISCSITE